MPLDVKAAVADALLELIRRKDADKITVDDRTAAGELPPAGSGPAGAGGSAVPPAVRRDGPPSGNLTDVPACQRA